MTVIRRGFDPQTRRLKPLTPSSAGGVRGDSKSLRIEFEYPPELDERLRGGEFLTYLAFDVMTYEGREYCFSPTTTPPFDGFSFEVPHEVMAKVRTNSVGYQLKLLSKDGEEFTQSLVDHLMVANALDVTVALDPSLTAHVAALNDSAVVTPVACEDGVLVFHTHSGAEQRVDTGAEMRAARDTVVMGRTDDTYPSSRLVREFVETMNNADRVYLISLLAAEASRADSYADSVSSEMYSDAKAYADGLDAESREAAEKRIADAVTKLVSDIEAAARGAVTKAGTYTDTAVEAERTRATTAEDAIGARVDGVAAESEKRDEDLTKRLDGLDEDVDSLRGDLTSGLGDAVTDAVRSAKAYTDTRTAALNGDLRTYADRSSAAARADAVNEAENRVAALSDRVDGRLDALGAELRSGDAAVRTELSVKEAAIRSDLEAVRDDLTGRLGGVYHAKGTTTNAGLPVNPEVGDVYNISDDGVFPVGSNVVWDGTRWDKLSETVDLSGYQLRLTPDRDYLTPSTAASVYQVRLTAGVDYTTPGQVREVYATKTSLEDSVRTMGAEVKAEVSDVDSRVTDLTGVVEDYRSKHVTELGALNLRVTETESDINLAKTNLSNLSATVSTEVSAVNRSIDGVSDRVDDLRGDEDAIPGVYATKADEAARDESVRVYVDDGLRAVSADVSALEAALYSWVNRTLSYRFEASREWRAVHNLGSFPSVVLKSEAGNQIFGRITYENENVIAVRFTSPVSGWMYLGR